MADFEVVDAPTNFKSKVRQYFGFARVTDQNGIKTLDKTETVWKVCEAQIAYGKGNATNMFTHLQRKHPKLHEEVEASKSKDSKPSQSVKGVVPSVKGIAPSGQCSLKDIHQMLKKSIFIVLLNSPLLYVHVSVNIQVFP